MFGKGLTYLYTNMSFKAPILLEPKFNFCRMCILRMGIPCNPLNLNIWHILFTSFAVTWIADMKMWLQTTKYFSSEECCNPRTLTNGMDAANFNHFLCFLIHILNVRQISRSTKYGALMHTQLRNKHLSSDVNSNFCNSIHFRWIRIWGRIISVQINNPSEHLK